MWTSNLILSTLLPEYLFPAILINQCTHDSRKAIDCLFPPKETICVCPLKLRFFFTNHKIHLLTQFLLGLGCRWSFNSK